MRQGVALPLSLFALALTSAASVGGLYVTRQLARSAHASQRGAELEPLAEEALLRAVAQWDSSARTTQAIGTTARLVTSDVGRARVSAWITRTTELDYWIVAEAEALAKPLLRRRLGVVIRTDRNRPRLISARAWAQLP